MTRDRKLLGDKLLADVPLAVTELEIFEAINEYYLIECEKELRRELIMKGDPNS